MIRAVSVILECLEKAKKAQNMQELLPVMMIIQPLETGIHIFFEEKLKPIHEAIQRGEDPFPKESNESPKDFDWNEYLKNMKPGEAN